MTFKEQHEKEKQRILNVIFSRGFMSVDEYERNFKGKYLDKYGCDSFLCYLSYIVDGDLNGYFVTYNDKIIKNRDMLEKKFGLKIRIPKEMMSY